MHSYHEQYFYSHIYDYHWQGGVMAVNSVQILFYRPQVNIDVESNLTFTQALSELPETPPL